MPTLCSIVAIAAALALAYTPPAYAYLDAGSVSLLLQGIVAAVAGGAAAIGLYWRKIKSFVFGRRADADAATPAPMHARDGRTDK